ncbi:ROK family protein [Streptomyces sp. NPDC056716]|uniref:ROK family protein n=1 Tax=unclassified Streptomyces TaxID=2593676 RepID=UPI003675D0F7
MSTTEVTAALDVGGTKIAAGLVAADGTVVHREERPTAVEGRLRDPGLAGTVAAARALLAEAGRRGLTVVALGAGFPEYVSADGLLTSREVLAWDVQPLKLLRAELPGAPVTVGSDARCGALGEARHGAGAGLDSFFYVSLGTGLSSALVLGGTPVPGRRGEAIALGEFEVPASVDPGWRGSLEGYCSGRGIGDRRTALGGATTPGAREVAELADRGDPVAAHVLASAGAALGAVLAMTVRLLDPAAIILGGGLGTARGPLRSAIDSAYTERAAARPDAPPLLTAALGPAAGLIGAACLGTA